MSANVRDRGPNGPAAPRDAVDALTESLARHGVGAARLAIVLGSGLSALADAVSNARSIPYEEITGMPRSAVPGHAGQLVVGALGGVPVVIQQGRVHLYEGWSARDVSRAVRAFVRLGCRGVLLTNAAGGLRREWAPGSLMRIVDHVNLQGRTYAVRSAEQARTPYDSLFGSVLDQAARERGIELHRGVYAGLLGPSYETPAEIRMLTWLNADAVGMSTVAEAVAASAAGARVAAISCITNLGAGLGDGALSHDDVVAQGKRATKALSELLEAAMPNVSRAL